MNLLHIRRALLLASSVAALGLGSPMALAQQAQSSATPKMQPAAKTSQQNLQQSIRTLEQARDRLGAAQQGQAAEARTQAQQALQRVETQLSGMASAHHQKAKESIDAAQETLERPQMDRQAATRALDRVIADVKTVHQQTGQASDFPQRVGQTGQTTDIQVDQKAPQVNVQQQAPQVTVKQPPPKVTIQQPEPNVTVDQARPKVTVEQQGEPRVTVQQQGKPEVAVQRPDAPRTTGERQGEPETTAQESASERMAREPGQVQNRVAQPAQPPTALKEGAQSTEPTTQAGDTGKQDHVATMGQGLVGKELYGADNRNMGEVEDVVMGQDDRVKSILIDVGGFLGIGARRVAIPISRIELQGDKLTTTMTEAQAKELPEYNESRR